VKHLRALYHQLQATGLPEEVGTGGRTKYNRTRLRLSKTHWHDAVAVGASTLAQVRLRQITPLLIKAMGHGTRQRCRTNAHGFPIAHWARQKRFCGFQTGDIVKAVVPRGKYAGTWVSHVAVRASGKFDLVIHGKTASVHQKHCTRLWSADGYQYTLSAVAGTPCPPRTEYRGLHGATCEESAS
jgi:hypothetical protein